MLTMVTEGTKLLLFLVLLCQYAKLGLSLSVPGGGIKKKSPSQGNTEGPAVTSSHEHEEDDEYAGGLC